MQTSAPMLRAYQTVAAYQVEHGEIGLTKSGAWNRHCIDWVVRRMDFPNWTAEKLYRVNKVLDEYDVPPLEYLRVLLTSLRLGRKMGGGWRLTKPGMALAGDPEAAFATITPAFLFRFDHSEGRRTGEAPVGDWHLWLHAALLHKSSDDRGSPFPGQTYPTTSVTGMPSAVKPFRTATRTWNSAT